MNNARRNLLIQSISVVGLLGSSKVFATVEEVEAAIKTITGDAEMTQGGLKLNTPEIAENGHSVPISVSIEDSLLDTADDNYVESIAVFADGNPNPGVITFNFSADSGEVFASTRMRLAKTQNVIAVAKLSDGTIISDTKHVKVTIGGCGG